ncbi:lipocalin family protein [Pedobacter fastidiosus]|uniref:lipocalin family protein n=1 Tax=Pedobacter fastidiosus TaxID=2765361 RepID=UPI0021D153AE|nr:lipocalin family protein [Pedobacter fastidiosus]
MKLKNFKFLCLLILLFSSALLTSFTILPQINVIENKAIAKINFKNFQGKWYSLTSIPTALDKKWCKTVENYTLKDDHLDVFTTYYKIGNTEQKSIKSKLFFYSGNPDGGDESSVCLAIKNWLQGNRTS